MLLRFAAAEDAARPTEVMSFALATVVVAERLGLVVGRATAPGWCPLATVSVPCSSGALLLARLTGEAGLAWLGQEPVALSALSAYFGPGPSELRAIAEDAARGVGHPLDRVGASEGKPAETDARDEETGKEDAESVKPSERVGGEAAWWRWISWVRDGLREGTITVNAERGWLHNITGEAYVVVPDGFEEFAAVEGVEARTMKNRVARLDRRRERSSGPVRRTPSAQNWPMGVVSRAWCSRAN